MKFGKSFKYDKFTFQHEITSDGCQSVRNNAFFIIFCKMPWKRKIICTKMIMKNEKKEEKTLQATFSHVSWIHLHFLCSSTVYYIQIRIWYGTNFFLLFLLFFCLRNLCLYSNHLQKRYFCVLFMVFFFLVKIRQPTPKPTLLRC